MKRYYSIFSLLFSMLTLLAVNSSYGMGLASHTFFGAFSDGSDIVHTTAIAIPDDTISHATKLIIHIGKLSNGQCEADSSKDSSMIDSFKDGEGIIIHGAVIARYFDPSYDCMSLEFHDLILRKTYIDDFELKWDADSNTVLSSVPSYTKITFR